MRGWEPGEPYLLGYSHRLSVRPGETVDIRVSTNLETYTADLVRLRHGDENPLGPGFIQLPVSETEIHELQGRVQATPIGSVIQIPPNPSFDLDPVTLTIWFLPTLFSGQQHLISWLDDAGEGFELVLVDDGKLEVRSANHALFSVGPLLLGTWHLVAVGVDRSAGAARLMVRTEPRSPVAPVRFDNSARIGLAAWKAGAANLMIGGRHRFDPPGTPEIYRLGNLYGRVADPSVWAGSLDHVLARLDGRAVSGEEHVVARWDYGLDPASDLCRDVGPLRHHGRLFNGGTRLVTGPLFSDSQDPPAPSTHNAIHLHGDEVLDAGWEPDLHLELPSGISPGVFAIRLSDPNGDVEDHIPLFVRGDAGEHRIALLLPTATYLAYGNERMNFGTIQLPDAERGSRFQAVDSFIEANPWLGSSLYDEHRDRSGVTRVSRHRPLVTMRPEHRSWLSGDPRHLSADLYLIDWLEHHGYAFDVITDDVLHAEGVAALQGYRVVLTGSHPEYVSGRMLDALADFLGHGGRLMYLGGNGFYWVTSFDSQRPDVIEVRRGFAGSRTWESAPGDEYHSGSNEPGGLWRHRGRPPNRLVGVGFAASGWGGEAGAYTVLKPVPERASFVFEGVDLDSPIGDFGLIMNGCVGDEVDRWDPRLGSPFETMRLATCADLNDSYVIVVEDTIGTGADITSASNPEVRADMVLMPTAGGGGVFSVGSMAWVGSLSHHDYTNNVSRITENVLERFLLDQPI